MFRDVSVEAGVKPQPWGTSCAFGDLDGDGKLDLYIGNYLVFGPQTAPQLCDTSGHLTACSPLFYKAERGTLYRNLGGGRFEDVTRKSGADHVAGKALGVVFLPADGARRAALAIANDEEPGDLLVMAKERIVNIGLQSGMAYNAVGKPQGAMGIDAGDYNNDAKCDLAIATFESEAKPIYRNAGRFFEDQSQPLGVADAANPYVAFGIKWLDLDNDGWLDLVVSNGHISDNIADFKPTQSYRQPSQLFHNLAGTRFQEITRQAGADIARPIVGRGLACGDFDNDGRMDLLIVDSEGAPLLLHNETTPTGHWLLLKLVGAVGNLDGFGAVVTAEIGGRKLTRYCHADGSYLSASDSRVHFGLGQAAQIDRLRIHWPSGHEDVFTHVTTDRRVSVTEGAAQLTPIF